MKKDITELILKQHRIEGAPHSLLNYLGMYVPSSELTRADWRPAETEMKEGKLFRNTVEGRKAFRTQLAKQLDELRRELDRCAEACIRAVF